MSRKHMGRKKGREGGEEGALWVVKNSLVGTLAAIVLMLVLTFVFAAIAYTRDDPDSLVGVLSFSNVYMSSLFAGLFSAKRTGKNALACGTLGGVMLMMFLFAMSLFFGDACYSGYAWGTSMAIRASVVALAILGGFIGVHKRNTVKRKRRRG